MTPLWHNIDLQFDYQQVITAAKFAGVRHYADLPDMTFAQIQERVFLVLRLYDKIDGEKVGLIPFL